MISETPFEPQIQFFTSQENQVEYVKIAFKHLFRNDNNFAFKVRANKVLIFYNKHIVGLIRIKEFNSHSEHFDWKFDEFGNSETTYKYYSYLELELQKKKILNYLYSNGTHGNSDYKNAMIAREEVVRHVLREKGLPDDLIKQYFNSEKLNGGSICWPGYHRVPGTVAYSKHSCKKS